MADFIFKRGEPINLALEAITGDPAQVTSVSASARKLMPGRRELRGDEPQAFSLAATYYPPAAGQPGGWAITRATDDIPLGNYIIDAKLTGAFGTEISSPVSIEIEPAAS